jgi:hypothetical protein
MCDCGRRQFLGLSIMTLGVVGALGVAGPALAAEPDPKATQKVWICPPCGCDNDGKEFPAAGPCTACGMPLMEKPAAPGQPG